MLLPIIDLRRASRLDIWSWFHTLYLSFFRKSRKSFSVLSALDTQVIASDNFSLAIVSITNNHRLFHSDIFTKANLMIKARKNLSINEP
jgi:hypothetical protein